VRHGERGIRPPDHEERLRQADLLRRDLAPIEAKIAGFQPKAQPGRRLLLDDAMPQSSNPDAPGVTQIEHPKNGQPIEYSPGQERGQLDDAGDLMRLPKSRAHLPLLGV